jgi:hypothetical protein
MISFEAHFDGEHLCPEEPVALPLNVRLHVIVVEGKPSEPVDDRSRDEPSQSQGKRMIAMN